MAEDLNEQALERTLSLLREAMERGEPVRRRITGLRYKIDEQALTYSTAK